MAFTIVTVTRDYDLADGTDPVGTVSFTPTTPMVNGPTVVAAKVTGRLNIDGILTIDLAANTDPATVPVGGAYLVEESIGGATRKYYVVIPHNAGSSIDLGALDQIITVPPPDAATWAALLAAKANVATFATQTLSSNGAVTINALNSRGVAVTLAANATSSSITNGAAGQVLTIEWIQDATGARSYVWPSNCKFAGGAAPTASTTATYRDSVTFRFDGTSWFETGRAAAVG